MSFEYDTEQFDKHMKLFGNWLTQDKIDFYEMFSLRMLIPHERWAFEIFQRIYEHPKFSVNTVEFCQKFLNLVFDYYFEIEGYMMDDFILRMFKLGIKINKALDKKLDETNSHHLRQFYNHLLTGSYRHCKRELFDYLYDRGIHLLAFEKNVIDDKLFWCGEIHREIKFGDLYFIMKLFNSYANRELQPKFKKMILPFITSYRQQTLRETCQEVCYYKSMMTFSKLNDTKQHCIQCAKVYFREIDSESIIIESSSGSVDVWINKLSFCSPECDKSFMGK